jgi:glycosyltransferase involved in cell wall biosynthesis
MVKAILPSPLVTVIIPLFNAEATISDTIRSVLNQTYPHLEVIVVDDASADNSTPIANEFAGLDSRVKVVRKEINQGLNLARATGFAQANGDYLTFIDSDDTYTPDAIQTLVDLQQSTSADICMAGFLYCSEDLVPLDPQWITIQPESLPTEYSHEDMLRAFLVGWAAWPHNNNPTSACSKLFRRELLAQVDWNLCNYRLGEDDFFSLITFNLAFKSAVTNHIIYHIRVSPTSLSLNPNRTFIYQDTPITALRFFQNFAKLAAELLSPNFAPEIAARLLALFGFYRDLIIPAHLAVEKDQRIVELELANEEAQLKLNQLYNSATWKLGRMATWPIRTARRLSNKSRQL